MSNLPALKRVTELSNPDEVLEADLSILHYLFCQLDRAWSAVESIDEYCKLSLTTIKVMDQRRKILRLDEPTKNSTVFYTPYD